MCIHQAHLVLESLGDARDEVAHVADARADGCERLALGEVAVHLQRLHALHINKVHVHCQVLEVTGQGACSSERCR